MKYDIVLTTYTVRLHCAYIQLSELIFTVLKTMYLEWPDFEAQQKQKAKAKRQKEKDPLFVSDSNDDDRDKKGSKAKKHRSMFHIESLATHLLIGL